MPIGQDVTVSANSKGLDETARAELVSQDVTVSAEPVADVTVMPTVGDVTVMPTTAFLLNSSTHGVTASSSLFTPSTPLFRCTHCQRILLSQNYDCCLGKHTPTRTAEQQCCYTSDGTVGKHPSSAASLTNPGNQLFEVEMAPASALTGNSFPVDDWFVFTIYTPPQENIPDFPETPEFLVRSYTNSAGDKQSPPGL